MSELASGGRVAWQSFGQPAQIHRSALSAFSEAVRRRDHQVAVQFQVDWNDLVQSLSKTTVLEFQAVAYAELLIETPGRYAVHCDGVHSILIGTHLMRAYAALCQCLKVT